MIENNGLDSFADIGLRTVAQSQAKDAERTKLGQEDFLDLMVAQLRNQDPFEPMENGEFLSQMAQFGTVSGIEDLQQSFKDLSRSLVSNQSLQAAALVGRQVLAPTGVGSLASGSVIKGELVLPDGSPDVGIKIYDSSGQLVRSLEMGAQAAGNVPFQWDGLRDDGSYAPPGAYFVTADAAIDGRTEALETLIANDVEAVTLGSAGLVLDLKGVGAIDFDQVKQIL